MLSLPDPEKTRLALQALIDSNPNKDVLTFGEYTLQRSLALVEGDANLDLSGITGWSLKGNTISTHLTSRFEPIFGMTSGPGDIVNAFFAGNILEGDAYREALESTWVEIEDDVKAQEYVDYHLAKLVDASAQQPE